MLSLTSDPYPGRRQPRRPGHRWPRPGIDRRALRNPSPSLLLGRRHRSRRARWQQSRPRAKAVSGASRVVDS